MTSKVLVFLPILAFTFTDARFSIGNVQCEADPEAVPHSKIVCDQDGCKMECIQGFKFPRGDREVEMNCLNGKTWGVRSYGNLMPECKATCAGGCRNGGECIAPNYCLCKENYFGDNCETKILTCPEKPPMPSNTMGKCVISGSSKQIQSCKVTCVEGYKFADNTLTADIMCRNGQWQMEPRHFDRCEPYCNPPCRNGGKCLGPNLCQCTKDFRGNLCQYRSDRCAPKNIGFNGMYKCTGYSEKMECRLSCPDGFYPEYQLASIYTCSYSEGIFRPQQVPQCDYRGMQVQISHAK